MARNQIPYAAEQGFFKRVSGKIFPPNREFPHARCFDLMSSYTRSRWASALEAKIDRPSRINGWRHGTSELRQSDRRSLRGCGGLQFFRIAGLRRAPRDRAGHELAQYHPRPRSGRCTWSRRASTAPSRARVEDSGEGLPLDVAFIPHEGRDVTLISWGAMVKGHVGGCRRARRRRHQH
jgi:hypothetical protein